MEKELSSKTVKQLKDQLRSLGLKVSGNKAELVQRIIDDTATTKRSGRSPRARSPKHQSTTGKVLTGANKDVDRLILLELDDVRLRAVCSSDKYAASVCNEVFWKLRVEQKYGEDVAAAKPKGISYRKQYFTLPLFVKKNGGLLLKGRLEAAKQGRLDAFRVYKDLWNHDVRFGEIFSILVKRGYRNILKEIILTHGKPSGYLQLREVFRELSKREDIEILDLIYKTYLTKKKMKDTYITKIISGNASDKILQWLIDNDLIDKDNINVIFHEEQKDHQLDILKFLSEHNLLPTINQINEEIYWISPAALTFLINKGLIPNIDAANEAASFGDIGLLNILEKHGILPDSEGANGALKYPYYPKQFIALKWMYKRGIYPNDEELIRKALNPKPSILQYPKNRKIYNWLKSSYE